MPRYPIRHNTHTLEELSKRYFTSCLPKNWVAFRPPNDYGVDMQVDIFNGELATGLELLIQLKSSSKASDNEETVRMKVSTYNYLWDKLQVVMVVKYVEEENDAYWLLLKDVLPPNQNQKTFTIHISKTNKLSEINWNEIRDYVSGITRGKLSFRRAHHQTNVNL